MVPSKTLGEKILTDLLEAYCLIIEDEWEEERVYTCEGPPDKVGDLYARTCVWLVNLEALGLITKNWELDHEEPGRLVIKIYC
ncbi:hypothetical protein [Iriri virus]|uniref:Uncharacterized protein n=1 Tax=Iriri virus TaxID=1620893 RepID=A0A0D3R195_9RHAB|nr:hypothetical protein [Iriri virus]AJR28381.1 hypothetical protein [Iriri virus]